MKNTAHMLAADVGDFAEILVIVVIVIFSIVGSIIKKVAEKNEQQRRTRPQDQTRESHAGTPRRASGSEALRRIGQSRQETPPPPQPVFAQKILHPQPMPVQQEPRHAYVAERHVPDEQTRVEQEERILQARMAEEQRRRARRMKAHQPAEADTSAIEARLLHIAPVKDTGEHVQSRLGRILADPDRARGAIIFHEILSPPKALREQPEMWEL